MITPKVDLAALYLHVYEVITPLSIELDLYKWMMEQKMFTLLKAGEVFNLLESQGSYCVPPFFSLEDWLDTFVYHKVLKLDCGTYTVQ